MVVVGASDAVVVAMVVMGVTAVPMVVVAAAAAVVVVEVELGIAADSAAANSGVGPVVGKENFASRLVAALAARGASGHDVKVVKRDFEFAGERAEMFAGHCCCCNRNSRFLYLVRLRLVPGMNIQKTAGFAADPRPAAGVVVTRVVCMLN